MEHQADDDANAEEQKDDEVESDGEESEEDEEEYEVLSLYKISYKKQFYNYKITTAVIFTYNSISKGRGGSWAPNGTNKRKEEGMEVSRHLERFEVLFKFCSVFSCI